MTRTPIPTPLSWQKSATVFTCDACGAMLSLDGDHQSPPPPWKEDVSFGHFVGMMVCSETCEETIRALALGNE